MATVPNPPSGPEIDVDPSGVTINGNGTSSVPNSSTISPLAYGDVKNAANTDLTLDVTTFQVQLKAGSPVNVAWVQFAVGPATVRIEKGANNKIDWKLNGTSVPRYARGTDEFVFPASMQPTANTSISYGTTATGTGTNVPAANFKKVKIQFASYT
ncbi:hypothetical protein ABI59_18630 [Acidobacteria bacterium Mor1]|nr:hypothetical protein ABI59_18630 [Acidobacteria bacterium Mor1]